MAIEFLKNLFKKKEAAAPQPEPQPEAQQPAPPQPVAAPAVKASQKPALTGRDVRRQLDAVSQALIAMDFGDPSRSRVVQQIGQSLQDLGRDFADDGPCPFKGFDTLLVSALRELPTLCRACTPEQLNDMFGKLAEAIRTRTIPAEENDSFAVTMEVQYYTVKLIELQGRIISIDINIAQTEKDIKQIMASESDAAPEILTTLRIYKKKETESRTELAADIDGCRLQLTRAIKKQNANEPVEHIDLEKVIEGISEDIDRLSVAHEERMHEINNMSVRVNMMLDEEKHRHSLELAAQEVLAENRAKARKRQQELGLTTEDAAMEEAAADAPVQEIAAAENELPAEAMPEHTATVDVDYDYVFGPMA